MELSNKQRHILHVIRNPDGHSEEVVRQARHDAADEIEALHEAIVNLREFAEANGLDTWARNTVVASAG